MKVNVCGIAFDKLTVDEAANEVFALIGSKRGGYVVTPNTEILARARDKSFFEVLSGATLVLCDGVGVFLIALLGCRFLPRATGIDLAEKLLEKAEVWKIPVFLYGAAPGVAGRAKDKLEAKYNGLKIVGVCHGFEREDLALDLIKKSEAKLVFVCTSSPKQELFAKKASQNGINAVFLALGGVLDVFSGDKKRAPKILRRLGLEWAYRFSKEPWRIKRFIGSVISGCNKQKFTNRP